MAVILGPVPQEQPLDYRIERISGTSYTRTWIGPKTALDTIAATEKLLAESIKLTGTGATYTLVANYSNISIADGTTEEPSETQEIDTDVLNQSIFLHPTFAPFNQHEVSIIRKALSNHETYNDAVILFSAPPVLPGTAGTSGTPGGIRLEYRSLAAQMYFLLTGGAETFENHAYRITRTRTASRRWIGKIDLGKINTLWTTAELAAFVGNTLLFDVPDLALTADEQDKNLFAGWRQTLCRVSDIANGARTLTEQWQLAKWSLLLYRRQNTV